MNRQRSTSGRDGREKVGRLTSAKTLCRRSARHHLPVARFDLSAHGEQHVSRNKLARERVGIRNTYEPTTKLVIL
jgi:hypothetical protein